MRISRRASAISASSTLALDARVKTLIRSGADIVNMAVGEPDFSSPLGVQSAAVAKVQSGNVRYTAPSGTIELREAIGAHLEATRGRRYGSDEVVVCHSCKHALSGAIQALVEEGDEVLLPLPAWVSYVELVRLAGGSPVEVPPEGGAKPDLAALEAAIGPATRGILLNTPNNPSGYLWTRADLEAVCALAREHDLWILSDEIYNRLVFDGAEFVSPITVAPDLADRIAILDGASKAFAMTGYRVGYLAGPQDLVAAVARLHSQTTGSPNAVSMEAFRAALVEEPPEVQVMVDEYARRRARLLEGLAELGLEYVRPDGAYYAFPKVAEYCDERGVQGFCEDLLEEEGLALVPGDAFRLDGYVRLCYALSFELLGEALERLGRFLARRRAQV